ncbi:MAG: hypothetical protein MZV64_28060 [Ignavibacteriales bacterium]|nr:hypothetical protein [Ignavibacteriales bacterium]
MFLAAALGAAWLARSGRLWGAAAAAACGVLVHESFVLVGLPLVLLGASMRPEADAPRGRAAPLPLALPVLAALALWVSETSLLDRAVLRSQLEARLSTFPFVGGDMNLFVPEWLTTGTLAAWREQRHAFWRHVSDPNLLRLMLPSAALLVFSVAALAPDGRRTPARRGRVAGCQRAPPDARRRLGHRPHLDLHHPDRIRLRLAVQRRQPAGGARPPLAPRRRRARGRGERLRPVAADGRRTRTVHGAGPGPALPALLRRGRPGPGGRLADARRARRSGRSPIEWTLGRLEAAMAQATS